MNLTEIKKIAGGLGIKSGKLKKAELIRTIQKTEGNFPCFETGSKATCGQVNCHWRDDCDLKV